MLLDFCNQKELCVANTWYKEKDKRNVLNSSGGNDTEIDFVLVGKEKKKYLRDVKVIPAELQHRLVVVDVEEYKLKKSLMKSKRVRWRVRKLKEEIKEKFEERVVKSVDTDSMDLWGSYKNGVLQACDKVCGKTKARGDRGNTWWWNEQRMLQIEKRKRLNCGAHIDQRKVKNHRKAKNKTKKVIAKAMKEEETNVLCTKPNDVFTFEKFMKKEGRAIEGGGCMKDKDGRLVVSEKDRVKIMEGTYFILFFYIFPFLFVCSSRMSFSLRRTCVF